MGFFKKIKNFLTDGGATVTLEILSEVYLRKPFDVLLTISLEDQDVLAERIYIEVKYLEVVRMQVSTRTMNGHSTTKTVTKESVLYEDRILLEKDYLLKAGTQYQSTNTIQLPLEAMPSFDGVHAKLIWTLEAFVEKSGHDPGSEKLIFDPLYELL